MLSPSGRHVSASLLAAVLMSSTPVQAADEANSQLDKDEIRRLTIARSADAIAQYRDFLSLPNDANYPGDILKLVDWMEPRFQDLGFSTRRIPTAGSPALFLEKPATDAEKTILVYLQADGQPVDPSAWHQQSPYEPVLKEKNADGDWEEISWQRLETGFNPDWRIFARSASDSKGPMAQFMTAMAILNEAGIEPAYNLKVIIDTEEEKGSPHLAAAIEANRELMASDFLIIFDGPPHASNRPTIKFGARGLTAVTLTTWGPAVSQHSGHYGNFVPNPAFHLSRILGTMKDIDGRVTIDGFYDGVAISDEDRAQLDRVPDDEEAILAAMQLTVADKVGSTLQEALQYPSLNIRGMRAAWVGPEKRTIIPATATAEIDIRLVKESDPEYLAGLLRAHIESLGYTVLDHDPSVDERAAFERIVTMKHKTDYTAYRSDFDADAGVFARAGMRNLYGEEPILVRTSGGSIPISPFVEILGVPAASVPTVNIDNNQHSPNENIRLGNFIEGISIILSVLSQVPE